MKKNLIFAAALMVVCLSNATAQERVAITESVSKNFEREYPGASQVEWAKTDQASVAQFRFQENFWVAYYNNDGEKFASGRKISEFDQLPLEVQQNILEVRANQEKKFGVMHTSYAIEMIEQGTTKYYLPMENNRISLLITSDNSGSTIVAKKQLKRLSAEAKADLLAKKN